MDQSSLRLCFIFMLLIFNWHVVVQAQDQKEEYSAQIRDWYDMDLSFEATILFDNGDRFRVKNFQISEGMLRHQLETGDEVRGVLLPLKSIRRIYRVGNTTDKVIIVFENGTEMNANWASHRPQNIFGISEDGTKREWKFSEIREIEVHQVEKADKK